MEEALANDLDYLIQQYSPTDDKWSSLPPARTPVRLFGLGELNGQLVVVGGMTNQCQVTEKVHTFNGKWKSIPPMPTARVDLKQSISKPLNLIDCSRV